MAKTMDAARNLLASSLLKGPVGAFLSFQMNAQYPVAAKSPIYVRTIMAQAMYSANKLMR